MSVFRQAEIQYLAGGRQLGRIATVGADGTPHVVPVAWIYNAVRDTIDIGGYDLERSKKFRDVARTERVAIAGGRDRVGEVRAECGPDAFRARLRSDRD